MWILEPVDDQPGATLTLEVPSGERRTIGRDPASDLILDRPLVSRLHCQVEAQGSKLTIADLDSTNGTFVNDRPITKATLAAGDQVTVGRTVFTVKRRE